MTDVIKHTFKIGDIVSHIFFENSVAMITYIDDYWRLDFIKGNFYMKNWGANEQNLRLLCPSSKLSRIAFEIQD